jgi:8-oxo-dGTP diphosphatase
MSGAPDRPLVGVGGVVIHQGRVLLIRRGKEPLKGRWVIPGGTVEVGETLEEALVREVREETGVVVRPLEVLTVFDRIERDAGRVVYHYVIIDYLCAYLSGEVCSATDAEAAAFVRLDQLADYDLPPKAMEVVSDGLRRAGVGAPHCQAGSVTLPSS